MNTDAAKLARITGVRSLDSEWQGRELVKSAAYPQLSENDQVPKSQKSAPEKFLRFLPEMTKLRVDNKNIVENRNRK